jgi:hypothetical protein
MLEQKYSLWVTVPLTGLLGCMSCIAGCDCFTTIKQRELTSDEAIRELEQRYHAQIEYREHPGHGNVPIEELNSVLEFKEDSK